MTRVRTCAISVRGADASASVAVEDSSDYNDASRAGPDLGILCSVTSYQSLFPDAGLAQW